MTLLLGLAFIPKTRKPVTDQGLEETQTKSSQQEPIPLISETTGSNNNDVVTQDSVHCISHSTVKIICMY